MASGPPQGATVGALSPEASLLGLTTLGIRVHIHGIAEYSGESKDATILFNASLDTYLDDVYDYARELAESGELWLSDSGPITVSSMDLTVSVDEFPGGLSV